MADKQEVYLSKSKSGKCGFFSGNYMSHPLTDAEFEELSKDPAKAKAKAQQLNYVLVNKVRESSINEAQKVGWYVTDIKDKEVFGPTSEQAAKDKCKLLGGDAKGYNVTYVSDYSARRQMEKESVESPFKFLQDLLTEFNREPDPVIEEVEELEEAVFPETHYTWFEVTAPMINLERRGKMEHIAKGEVIGIRRATSSDGKYRLITKKRGPTIIFSVERTDYDKLKKQFKPLKGSLND